MLNEPMYQKIYKDLLNEILTGKYKVGDRLPSENELSESYGVSRITSKKSLEIMADRGYVMRQPGKGTFVLKVPNQAEEDTGDEYDNASQVAELQSKRIIGVIMDSFGYTFGPDLIRGLEYECRRRGYLMMLRFSYGSMEVETQALNEMVAAGASGIILMCAQGETYNSDILKLHLDNYPLVLVDRSMQGIPIPVVTTDNLEASKELTEYLISKGHKKICFLSHSSMQTTTVADRYNGYVSAMSANGLLTDESLLLSDLDTGLPVDDDYSSADEYAKEHISKYIDEHPDVTAFFAVEFSIALMLFNVLVEKGLTNDKEIVYFDGYEGGLGLDPKFEHVIQNQYQMGVTSVRMLAHLIRGDEVATKELIPYIVRTD